MKTVFLFLFLFSVSFSLRAQSNGAAEKSEISISFGNTITPEQIGIHGHDSFQWQITDETSRVIADQGQGSFFSYVFLRFDFLTTAQDFDGVAELTLAIAH